MPQQLLAVSQMVGENQRRMSFSYTDSHIFHNEVHQNCNRETGVTLELCLAISTQASQELNYHTLYTLQCVSIYSI